VLARSAKGTELRILGQPSDRRPVLIADIVVDLDRVGIERVVAILAWSRDPVLLTRVNVEVGGLVAAAVEGRSSSPL
jgi:hypothetical protein